MPGRVICLCSPNLVPVNINWHLLLIQFIASICALALALYKKILAVLVSFGVMSASGTKTD